MAATIAIILPAPTLHVHPSKLSKGRVGTWNGKWSRQDNHRAPLMQEGELGL